MSTLQVNRIIPLTGSSVYIEGGTFESASYLNPLIQDVYITGSLSVSGVISSSGSSVVTNATFTPFSSSVSTRVSSLESWSSSLDLVYATDAQLNASASALQAGVTSSISVATQNLQAGVTASIAGFATTGSNTFTGINRFDIVSASYIQALSASIEYLSVIYQTSSVVFSSGSNQLGDSPSDTQTLYGTVDIKNGPVLVTGSMGVSGTATATSGSFGHVYADFIRSSFLFASGSNQLGDSAGDFQVLYGTVQVVDGVLSVTGSIDVANRITTGELTVLYGITGSLFGTASYAQAAISTSRAVSALNADTASYVQQAVSASYAQQSINAFTASYIETAQTASYVFQAQNAFTASYAQQAENAFTASYVTTAQSASYVQSAQTASYVSLAQSASYVTLAQTASYVFEAQTALTASFVQQAQTALTASYVANAVSASFAAQATSAATASSADNFTARGFVGVGGPVDAFHQMYVTTSISDGTLGLDSSGEVNALYFLKSGVRGFEISTAVGATHVTQLLPYTSSGFFKIGNPSNASNDLIFLSEPTNGNVLLGPGILTGSTALSGSQSTDKVQLAGDTFVSGALTVLGTQFAYGPIQGYNGFTGSLQGTADTAISAPYYVLTASYNADSASVSTRVTNLESWSSSLDGIYATDAQLNAATGALQTGVTASINLATGSLQAGVTASIAIATGSLQTGVTASINALSSSVAPEIANLQVTASNLTTASSSFSTRVSTIEGNYATTGSNTFTGVQYITDISDAISFTSTASLYTDGGLRVAKNAFVSGNLDVAGNFTIFGTASINYVTTSVFVGLEFIDLNTDLPALRYAGINVGDSGSSGVSSSFWYDSTNNDWIFVHAEQNQAQTSSIAIFGPITYGNLGNEVGVTGNYLTKGELVNGGDHDHHITSSQIYDDGTTVAIAGNLQVTGSLYASNLTGSLNGSNLVVGSVANDKLTNSTISGIALGSNLATLTIGTGLSGTSYNGSTGVTIANTGVTSIAGGTGVTLSGASGAVTASIGQAVATNSNVQFANITSTNQFVTVSGGVAAINITGSATEGGASYIDFLRVRNNSAGATNPNKSFRVFNDGTFQIVNSAYTSTIFSFTDAGAFTAAADVTAFSDARLKENVNTITDAVDKVTRLRGVTYTRIDLDDKSEKMGVIAQETQAVTPQVVSESADGTLSVAYGNLSGLFIEAFKEQQAEINDLKATVLELQEIISKLK